MGSGSRRDITPAMVQRLGNDMVHSPNHPRDHWQDMQQDREQLARYITARLNDAFPDQPDARSRALTVILEVVALDEHAAFVEDMQRHFGGKAPILGNVALCDIAPESIPNSTYDDTTF